MNYSLAVLFGITTALGWGLAPIFSKRAYNTGGNPIVASLILSLVGFFILMIVSIFFYGIDILFVYDLQDIYPFIISGAISTGFGRFLSYKSIDVVGAGINSAFIASNSVFGILLAYIFLNETLTNLKIIGVLLVLLGLYVISISKGGDRNTEISKILLTIPLLASFLYGFGSFIRRFGLDVISDIPFIYAVTINEFTALILLTIYLLIFKKDSINKVKIKSYRKFILSGVFNVIGVASSFAALNYGPVYIGATIGSTSTLITIVSTYILLNDLEKITRIIVIGSLLVISGVILVVL